MKLIRILCAITCIASVFAFCACKNSDDETTNPAGETVSVITTEKETENPYEAKDALKHTDEIQAALSSALTVSTQALLNDALNNDDVSTVLLQTEEEAKFTADVKTNVNKTLIVDIPNGTLFCEKALYEVAVQAAKTVYINKDVTHVTIFGSDISVRAFNDIANIYITGKNISLSLESGKTGDIYALNATTVISNYTSGSSSIHFANGSIKTIKGKTLFDMATNQATALTEKAPEREKP